MADSHKSKTMVRVDDQDYDYVCMYARRINPRSPNCTEALRRIIAEHRGASVDCKWHTGRTGEDVIM